MTEHDPEPFESSAESSPDSAAEPPTEPSADDRVEDTPVTATVLRSTAASVGPRSSNMPTEVGAGPVNFSVGAHLPSRHVTIEPNRVARRTRTVEGPQLIDPQPSSIAEVVRDAGRSATLPLTSDAPLVRRSSISLLRSVTTSEEDAWTSPAELSDRPEPPPVPPSAITQHVSPPTTTAISRRETVPAPTQRPVPRSEFDHASKPLAGSSAEPFTDRGGDGDASSPTDDPVSAAAIELGLADRLSDGSVIFRSPASPTESQLDGGPAILSRQPSQLSNPREVPAAPAAGSDAGGADHHESAEAMYARIERRLRRELLADRERKGYLAEAR